MSFLTLMRLRILFIKLPSCPEKPLVRRTSDVTLIPCVQSPRFCLCSIALFSSGSFLVCLNSLLTSPNSHTNLMLVLRLPYMLVRNTRLSGTQRRRAMSNARLAITAMAHNRSEEHTSELQSRLHLV